MDDPSVVRALVIHEPSMFQTRQTQDHEPASKGKGKCKSLKTMFRFVTSHLGQARGGRAGREEPLPPTSPGTHLKTVSSIDGSIKYVKVDPKVSNHSCSGSI